MADTGNPYGGLYRRDFPPYGGLPNRNELTNVAGAIANPYGTITPLSPTEPQSNVQIPLGTGPNPYQVTQRPIVAPEPSRGQIGDFLREITAFRGTAPQPTVVPTAPVTSTNIPIPADPNERARAYNAAQVAGGIVPAGVLPENRITALSSQRPALANFLPKSARFADDQSARVSVPRGYTPPTPEDIATANAVSNAYFAPYRRNAQLENYKLETERIKARAPYEQKAPTLRDQLYGQATEAAKNIYALDVAAAETLTDPKEQAKARQAAQRKYLQGIIDLAQPKAAEAGLLRGE